MQTLSIAISMGHARQGFFAECSALSLQLPKQCHMRRFQQQNHTTEQKEWSILIQNLIIVQQVKIIQHIYSQNFKLRKHYLQTERK
jgi:hypothetical protein